MASDIDAINMALLMVGSAKIGSVSDSTKSARLAQTILVVAREQVFGMPINWNFATTRAILGRLSTDPIFGKYDFQYTLPNDAARPIALVDVDNDDFQFEFRRETVVIGSTEHDVILTNETTANLKYVRQRTDPAKFPEAFFKLWYMTMATILAAPLKQDKQKVEQLTGLWQIAFNEARQANGMENVDVNKDNIPLDKGNMDVLDAAVGRGHIHCKRVCNW